MLFRSLGATLPWESLPELRRALVEAVPVLAMVDQVPRNAPPEALPEVGALGEGAFGLAVGDFYLTNPIARASELMAELSARARARESAVTSAA